MSGDKTEQPTPKKLRDARKEGQIAKSQELPATATTIALFAVIFLGWGYFFNVLNELFHLPLSVMNQPFEDVFYPTLFSVLACIAKIVLPVILTVMLLGTIANLIQVGFLFSMKAAMPKLSNMNPKQWFQKTFSIKNLVEFIKSTIKVLVIGYVAVWVVKKHIMSLQLIPRVGIGAVYSSLGTILFELAACVAGVMVLLAALDYLFQHWQHIKKLRMSKDEVKREYKEMEGDAQIKSKRKQLHQELLAEGSTQATRKATVLVTNPTRIAVALFYEEGETPLPVVLAKGEGALAQRMVAAAREEGIPIMQNVPLARALLADARENEYIPGDLVRQVADVLLWVKSLE
ncbi:type III secretion system export apparatus subunit SctU [Desulfospira joergensenii]|uniref:type III secretion system export apparatus subunit SctU n=1 Tax=Desulfospira joergensenii TaxID=53329 RepID=UPI00041CAD91|nr:type III secretion system export apparatus subunit SctU [Desulfospira joergensenii]